MSRCAQMTTEYLDAQASTPFWKAAKSATIDALDLQLGTTALDVGCGTGEQARTMAAFEPDWDTLVFDAGPLAATRSVGRAWADSIANPAAGRQIARRLRKLGALDVQIEPRTAALTDLASAEQQYALTELATATLSGAAARSWLGTLRERDEAGAFLAAVTYFLVTARKPS